MALQAATAARVKIQPRQVRGPIRRMRWTISGILQALLFLGPWIQWHGRQAVLLDIDARRLYFFDLTFWPQDTYFVLIGAIFAALLLFASTAVAGRVWCGYACPQTLLTDCFMLVEHILEGDRAARLRLARAPWTKNKIITKAAKYSIYTAMALWLGVTVAGYLQPMHDVISGLVSPATIVLILSVAVFALFAFGWFREQACHYVCPYARFQSALQDADTLIVGYDRRRGEPRGKVGKAAGDCVDCTLCVQVCPMGIDIREGLQMECVGCTACVDACDGIMDQLLRPRGLIRYSSLNALEGHRSKLLRPRVVVYGVLLASLAALFVTLLARRAPLAVDAVREVSGAVYALTPDGRVSNAYTLHLFNKDRRAHRLRVTIEDFADGTLLAARNPIEVAADSELRERVMVLRPAGLARPVQSFKFKVVAEDAPAIQATSGSSFIGPLR